MEKKFKIGVIGVGMVGTPLVRYFMELKVIGAGGIFLFDKDPKKK